MFHDMIERITGIDDERKRLVIKEHSDYHKREHAFQQEQERQKEMLKRRQQQQRQHEQYKRQQQLEQKEWKRQQYQNKILRQQKQQQGEANDDDDITSGPELHYKPVLGTGGYRIPIKKEKMMSSEIDKSQKAASNSIIMKSMKGHDILVEDASDSQYEDNNDDDYKSIWRNRLPSPGEWMEPVQDIGYICE